MRIVVSVYFLTLLLVLPVTNPLCTSLVSETTIPTIGHPGPERIYGEMVIQQIYENISTGELRDIVQEFTENGSRFINGPYEATLGTNRLARQYIIEHLEEFTNGRIEIEIIGDYLNVIGRLPGYLPGEHPVFVVGAHYDSHEDSPGANCNGGGIAAMLTLARVMAQYEWPLDIYFMAFNGQPRHGPELRYFLEGSEEVAAEMWSRGLEILAFFNIDTVLYPHPNALSDEQVLMGYDAYGEYYESHYWADLTRIISNNYGYNTIVPVPSNSFYLWIRSDQFSFYERGYSGCVCAFESGYADDMLYQNFYDLWDAPTYRYTLLKDVTAAIGGSISYVMGRTYGESRKFNFSLTTRSGDMEQVYIPISTSTNLEISCRWYGGPASFNLLDSNGVIIGSAIYDSASAWEPTDLFNIPVSELGLYTLHMYNTGNELVTFELTYTYDSDIDGNTIPDSQEFWLDPIFFSTDNDSDQLSAAQELFLGTDDTKVDSDFDTLPDKFEVDNGLDPTDSSDGSRDDDQDGLTNAEEYSANLNMFSADSDQDQMPDLYEIENGLNPLFDDSMLDLDGDGKTNLQEFLEGTDPRMIELEPIPMIWFIAPGVAVAFVLGLYYYRKMQFEY